MTEREYLYAGIPILSAILNLLGHPLLVAATQLSGAAWIAYSLTERWQRWRQRREFQYRLMGRFSRNTEQCFGLLVEALRAEGRANTNLRRFLGKSYARSRWHIHGLLSETELMFENQRIAEEMYLMIDAMTELEQMTLSQPPAQPERYDPVLLWARCLRDLVMARMSREMALIGSPEVGTAIRVLEEAKRELELAKQLQQDAPRGADTTAGGLAPTTQNLGGGKR